MNCVHHINEDYHDNDNSEVEQQGRHGTNSGTVQQPVGESEEAILRKFHTWQQQPEDDARRFLHDGQTAIQNQAIIHKGFVSQTPPGWGRRDDCSPHMIVEPNVVTVCEGAGRHHQPRPVARGLTGRGVTSHAATHLRDQGARIGWAMFCPSCAMIPMYFHCVCHGLRWKVSRRCRCLQCCAFLRPR